MAITPPYPSPWCLSWTQAPVVTPGQRSVRRGPAPVHLDEVDAILTGSDLSAQTIKQAGEKLIAAADPVDDVRGSAEYRRMIIPGLLQRAVDELREVE